MDKLTPGLRQAAFLTALAHHLTAHPYLAAVRITGSDLQLAGVKLRPDEEGAALLAWADTLTAPTVAVRNIKDMAYVFVTGSAGPAQITVWTTVPGLLPALTPPVQAGGPDRSVSLDQLRRLVAGLAGPRRG